MEEHNINLNKNPYDDAPFISRLFHTWLTKTIKTGYKRNLTVDDVYQSPDGCKSNKLTNYLQSYWEAKRSKSLFFALFWIHSSDLLKLTFIGLIVDMIKIGLRVQTVILLRYIIKINDEGSVLKAYLVVLSIAISSLAVALLQNPYYFGLALIGMKIRVSICSMIYRKSMKLSYSSREKADIGHIVNLMSNDVNRFDYTLKYLPHLIIAPIGMVIIYMIMYSYIEGSATFGYAILLFALPIQTLISKLLSKYRLRIALLTDKRVSLMNEIISGMRVLKLYCWEIHFSDLIYTIRNMEYKFILKSKMIQTVVILGTYRFNTKLAIFGTVALFVIMKGSIDAETVIIILGLFSILKYDVTLLFPFSIQYLFEVYICILRIQKFLELEEYESKLVKHMRNKRNNIDHSIRTHILEILSDFDEEHNVYVRNMGIGWTKDNRSINILNDINLTIKKGELVGVIGPVGSGKSSFLMALLGELP